MKGCPYRGFVCYSIYYAHEADGYTNSQTRRGHLDKHQSKPKTDILMPDMNRLITKTPTMNIIRNETRRKHQCRSPACSRPSGSSSSLSSIKPSSRSRLRRLSASAAVLRRRSRASLRAAFMSMPTISSPSSSSMLILSWSAKCAPRRHDDGRKKRITASAMRSRSESVCADMVWRGRYWE